MKKPEKKEVPEFSINAGFMTIYNKAYNRAYDDWEKWYPQELARVVVEEQTKYWDKVLKNDWIPKSKLPSEEEIEKLIRECAEEYYGHVQPEAIRKNIAGSLAGGFNRYLAKAISKRIRGE